MGYISNFIVYTLAMVGVIVVALLVFKNATSVCGGKSSKYLKVIDSMSLGQRKNLYIVSTGKEQFLVASDVNNTTLISKIDNVTSEVSEKAVKEQALNYIFDNKIPVKNSFKETLEALPKYNYMDKSNLGIKSSILSEKPEFNGKVMQNLAEIMRR